MNLLGVQNEQCVSLVSLSYLNTAMINFNIFVLSFDYTPYVQLSLLFVFIF